MKAAILILAVLGAFIFGFFLMARLDQFLDEHRKAIEQEQETREPSCVMLTEELSDDEMMAEVRRFRSRHKGARIVLYDGAEVEYRNVWNMLFDKRR